MTAGTAKDVAAVVAVAGELVGRTRLQKTVALLEMSGLGFGFFFQYYKFGPYSEALSTALDFSIALGYVSEEEKRANWGGRYSIYNSSFSGGDLSPSARSLISLAKAADAVALELAATAAFLAQEGVASPWDEVLARKPEKSESLAKAKLLYGKLRQISGLPKALPAI